MAIKTINVGTIANDGTGDDLREAFVKVNENFADLDARASEQTTASNLGSTGESIFAQKVNYDLQFKKLVAGPGTTLSSDAFSITIDSTGDRLYQVGLFGDSGSSLINDANPNLTIGGGLHVTTSVTDNVLTISSETVLEDDANPRLGANLDGNGFAITGTSNIESLIYGVDIREIDGIQPYIGGMDFGDINRNVTNFIEFLQESIDVDFGTFDSPASFSADYGNLS